MVKFGLRLEKNKSADFPPEAYVDYDKLKEIIHVLAKKKLAIPGCGPSTALQSKAL